MKTYFIFSVLPKHVEYFAGTDYPLMQVGSIVNFDLELKDPRLVHKSKRVLGDFYAARCSLRYSNQVGNKAGLRQYIEWVPVKSDS
jgi:hypothetical protein